MAKIPSKVCLKKIHCANYNRKFQSAFLTEEWRAGDRVECPHCHFAQNFDGKMWSNDWSKGKNNG